MEQIRAFIAIELPDAVKEDLSSLLKRLQPSKHPYVKWVAIDSIHLTLKFLGNIYPDQVPGLTESINSAARGVTAFQLKLGETGAFPNLQRPRVLWVSLTGDIKRVKLLQQNIDVALSHFGFAREKRPFTPHLTLGRLKDRASPAERTKIGNLVAATRPGGGASLTVTEISLMQSTLKPTGAVYDQLAAVKLQGR
jgi:2'-5' RNA ligase